MARELMLLVATVIVCLATGMNGQDHLSFAADQQVKPLTRDGCGSSRLCIETPDNCDPTHPDCLFASIVHNKNNSPTSFDVTLSGQSAGYIAMGITRGNPKLMPAAVFVCAQNNEKNGEFFFFSMLGDSEGNLTPLRQNTNEIRGAVHHANNMITCEFSIPLDGVDMTMDTMLHVLLGTGPATGKLLGVMTTHLDSGKIDLTDPTSA